MSKHYNFRKETSTYMPMLIKTVQMTDGPVMELGSGLFSTPLLHWLCQEDQRKVVSYENDPEFYKFSGKFRSKNHKVILIQDWKDIDVKTHWSVVLIDHSPKRPLRRGMDIIRLKNNADYIIIHDTGPEIQTKYGYEEVWPHFKYRHDWKKCSQWTTVVSNFKDLSHL